MAIPKPSFCGRHILIASILFALSQLASIYIIDVPKSIYHCPLNNNNDRHHRGLTHHYFGSPDENCYWSTSYADAREKFVSLGNRLKEQVLQASNHNNDDDGNNQEIVLNVVDVQSISYDIAYRENNNYPKFLTSIEASDVNTPQTVLPEKDTIDVLLLTMRILESSNETTNNNNNNNNNDEKKHNVDIIHASGTHGIEGYIGSAVQSRFLHELFMDNEKRLLTNNKNPHEQNNNVIPSSNNQVLRKVLLIHAVNPYGMRHHRRTNENNVDLNRNVLSDDMWSDIRKRDPNFVGYVDLDPMLNPFQPLKEDGELFSWVDAAREGGFEGDLTKLRERDESVRNSAAATGNGSKDSHQSTTAATTTTTIGPSPLEKPTSTLHSWLEEQLIVFEAFVKTIGAILNVGYTNAKRTLVASQYHKPSGIFYGGGAHNDDTWENSIFAVQHAIRTFAGLRFDDDDDGPVDGSSGRAIFIDVHTGLGKWGEYSVLLHGPTDSSEMASSSSSSSSSCDDEPISNRRNGKLGDGTSPTASSADCTQNLDIQLFEDSPILTFRPEDAFCKSGKVFVGTSVVGSHDNGGAKRITLVPNSGREGTFTASVNDFATAGDIYSISPDGNGDMRTVKRNQRGYAPEDESPSSAVVAPPDANDDDDDDDDDTSWTRKLISLLEETGMGYGQSADASVSEGYDQSVGFLNDCVLCPPPHCFPFTQEFGTRPGVGVAIALILENKAYNSRGEPKYGHLTSWAFNPQRLSWRRKSLRGGMDMLHAMLNF